MKKEDAMKILVAPDHVLLENWQGSEPYQILREGLSDEQLIKKIREMALDIVMEKATKFHVIDKNGNKKIVFEYLGE